MLATRMTVSQITKVLVAVQVGEEIRIVCGNRQFEGCVLSKRSFEKHPMFLAEVNIKGDVRIYRCLFGILPTNWICSKQGEERQDIISIGVIPPT